MTKSYCARCKFETNHLIVGEETEYSDDPEYDYREYYYIVKCAGCNELSFKKECVDIEHAYPDKDGSWIPEISVYYYPEKLIVSDQSYYHRHLPRKIRVVFLESIKSLNSKCYLLAGGGFRAVIEAVCIKEKISGRTLQNKIDNLAKKRLITDREAKRLHSIRFLGNDSIHEMTVPSQKKLLLVHNIIENLLKNLYVIDNESKDYLETVIDEYEKFEDLLKEKINTFSDDKSLEVPLAKILGKDMRRFNGKIGVFESDLNKKIKLGEFNELSIGKFDFYGDLKTKKVQNYKII